MGKASYKIRETKNRRHVTYSGNLKDAIEKAKNCKGMPTVVICKTVKGKGVSFMENEAAWHGTAPSKEQCEKALAEIGGDR